MVKFVSLFPDSPSFPETLWGGKKGGREGGGEGGGLVGLLLAGLVADVVLADLLADVPLADVLLAGLLALLLGALQAVLRTRRSDTMYCTELCTPNMLVCVSMATAISITVFTITGQLCFLPVGVVLLEKVVHNQGVEKEALLWYVFSG